LSAAFLDLFYSTFFALLKKISLFSRFFALLSLAALTAIQGENRILAIFLLDSRKDIKNMITDFLVYFKKKSLI
jgi:hypothetical protein